MRRVGAAGVAGHAASGGRGAQLLELDAFDGDLALDARVPGDLDRAEPARAGLGKGCVAVEYELIACHADSIKGRAGKGGGVSDL